MSLKRQVLTVRDVGCDGVIRIFKLNYLASLIGMLVISSAALAEPISNENVDSLKVMDEEILSVASANYTNTTNSQAEQEIEKVVEEKVQPKQIWSVSRNDATLRRVLIKWAHQAGWQLHWEAPVDLPIAVDANFEGEFTKVIGDVFAALSVSEVNLSALLYTGNRVLRITESGQRAQ